MVCLISTRVGQPFLYDYPHLRNLIEVERQWGNSNPNNFRGKILRIQNHDNSYLHKYTVVIYSSLSSTELFPQYFLHLSSSSIFTSLNTQICVYTKAINTIPFQPKYIIAITKQYILIKEVTQSMVLDRTEQQRKYM